MMGKQWPAGLMVRRLTSDQEIAGSSPASVTLFFFLLSRCFARGLFAVLILSIFYKFLFQRYLQEIHFAKIFCIFFNTDYEYGVRSPILVIECITIHKLCSVQTTETKYHTLIIHGNVAPYQSLSVCPFASLLGLSLPRELGAFGDGCRYSGLRPLENGRT